MKTNEDMLQALAGILAIESVSEKGGEDRPYGAGCARALDYMLRLCEELGFRTKNCNNRLGYAEIGQGEELVGILVHLDVVPAGNGWDWPPYALTHREGKLFGRGVVDDKGPAVACVFAMRDLLDSGRVPGKRIRIIFGLAEETGDWTDMDYYKETEELPGCGFTPDADFPTIYGEKGIVHFALSLPLEAAGVTDISGGAAVNMVADSCKVTLPGKDGRPVTLEESGRAAHGSTPQEGENAISKVMAAIPAREDLSGCPLAEFYNAVIGFDLHGERAGCALEDAQSGKLTLNVGKAEVRERQAVLAVDIRYPVTKTMEEVEAGLAAAAAPYGVTVKLTGRQAPVYMDKDGPWLQTLMAAYREETGDLEAQPLVIGGGTYARAMANVVAFGPLLPGREATEHQKNEYLLEEDFYLLRRIYRRVLEKVCNEPG